MATAINMPQVGQDLETAVITEWLVKVGDEVAKGDIIAVVDSDKASFEVEAFEAGTVLQILYQEGEVGKVFEPIAFIGKPGELPDVDDEPIDEVPQNTEVEKAAKDTELAGSEIQSNGKQKQFVSPSAKRVARENKVELADVTGTGPGSRVIKSDILDYLKQKPTIKATPVAKNIASSEGVDLQQVAGSGPGGRIHKYDVIGSLGRKSKVLQPAQEDEVIYFDKMRKLIADRLTFSKQTIPHYYLFVEVDVTKLLQFKQKLAENPGIKVSINDMLVQVVAKALVNNKQLNAHVDDEKVVVKPAVNIGIAVSVDNGLLVPVLASADQMTLQEISETTRKLASDARRGVVNTAVQGTFTISNLGMYGIKRFNAIINPPECGILTVGAIEQKVVPRGRSLEIIDMMELGLAVDHRAVDGATAAEFLGYIKQELENYNNE